jgi:hypothetical protein
MMGLLKGNGSHQKHNHTKDLQQLSLIIIAGMLFIVQGAFQRNVFEYFELCEFVLFIFAKLENVVVFLFIMEERVCIYVVFGDWLEIVIFTLS